MSRYLSLTTMSLFLGTLSNGAVHADRTEVTIYSSHGAGQRFGKIDPLTGVGTDIGPYTNGFPFVGGVSTAFDRDGTAYSYFLEANEVGALVGSQLATVDRATGVSTMRGDLGPVLIAHEIALDGTMYGIQHVQAALGIQGTPYFYEVDPQTAELTQKANTEINRSMDMAFQSNGTLWVVGGDTGNELYTIDPATGNATLQSTIQVEAGVEIMGIMFDLDGMLGTSFFWDDEPTSLYRINPLTGETTEIGTTGLSNTHGGDVLPTPATLLNDLRGALDNMEIPRGISKALAAKLDNAYDLVLSDADHLGPIHHLETFAHFVGNHNGTKIPSDDADLLIGTALDAVTLLRYDSGSVAAVPEPSGSALLLLGILGVIASRRHIRPRSKAR